MQVTTIDVLWPAEFGTRVVKINAGDFDPAIHRDPHEAPPVAVSGHPIPSDFPGALSLAAAGITDLSQLDGKAEADLTAIKGIGNATAKAILEAHAKLTFTES